MASDQALAYLQSFPDWERGTAGSAETYTLDRMRRFLELLGHPDQAYPIVHVVGTKGKGSTAAMIAAGLRAAGPRVGLFTSPHLVDYRERVRVDGRMIPPAALAAIVDERLRPVVERLRAASEKTPLAFEMLCALAFEHFRRAGVAAAVVEAGLGGRLDATNAVAETALTAITTIGYDHTAVLGETLAAIAGEKAAVVRPAVPVVSAPQPPEALAVIEETCRARGAELQLVGREWRVERVVETLDETVFDLYGPGVGSGVGPGLYGPGVAYENLRVSLAGAHQATNAAVAVAALTLLRPRFPDLDGGAVRRGLADVSWPGRLRTVARDPLVILDGAHNRESAAALAGALSRLYPDRPFVLVAAIFRDKSPEAILVPLLPLAAHVVVAASDHPRALPASALAETVRSLGGTADETSSVAAAIDRARTLAGPTGRVLVTGSLHTVGEAMRHMGIEVGDA